MVQHHASVGEQGVGRCASLEEVAAALNEPAPEVGRPLADVLNQFAAHVAPFACRIDHPRFLAFVPSGAIMPSILGELLCAGVNFFGGVWLEAPGPTQVELVVLDWFRSWLGLPRSAGGLLTSGGSEANLTALVVARRRIREADRGRAVLYVTEQRHWSIDRAAMVMGLLGQQVKATPVDGQFRMRTDALAEMVRSDREAGLVPWAVVANAGATNTGAIDPLAELAEFARREALWLHVDAAYGWTAVLTAEGRRLLSGIEQADSITFDPHKWLAQTYESGGVLLREGSQLEKTFAIRPDYLQDVEPGSAEVNFADRGLSLTRRFRALKLWISLKTLGVSWFRALVERSCALARYMEGLLEQAGSFEVLSPAQLSVVCFRHVPSEVRRLDDHNQALAAALRATGQAFLSTTRLNGRVALRCCFVNWRTTAADVEEVVRLLVGLGEEILANSVTASGEASARRCGD